MISTVYDYYLTTYAKKPATRSDTHKKSELKDIYHNIVKLSRKSPLYKLDVSEDIQRYAIDLKENARSIKSATDISFEKDATDATSGIQKKRISTDPNVLDVRTLGNQQQTDNTNFQFEVRSLAEPQVNTGTFLRSNGTDLYAGNHVFNISVGEYSYEFQFNVNQDDTNKSVQEKLARLINRSEIGLTAQVLTDENNHSALRLTSVATGAALGGSQFTVENSSDYPEDRTIAVMGLDNVSQISSNAEFILNGMEKFSSTNTFTINKSLEITLKGVSEPGTTVNVQFQDDVDAVIQSVQEITDSYNNILNLANRTTKESDNHYSLEKDIKRIAMRYKNDLESVGLNMEDDGSLKFDSSLIIQSGEEGTLSESLEHLKNFKSELSHKAQDISLNPMKYVRKVMISYPNPVKTFTNPYVTSIYTGMMFNGYI